MQNNNKKEILTNKDLQNKINILEEENERIKKEKTNVILEKIDSIVAIEKYIDVINNKFIYLKNKLHYDSFFTYPNLYVKFNYRNIVLPINMRKTYGFHYCYSCHYKNFEIGYKSNTFMLVKLIPNFRLSVFLYYYKKKNKLILSIDGQIKDEKNHWIYFINTINKNHDNPDFQEINVPDYNNFKWPIKHTVIFKDSMLNDINESVITISNEKI